MELCLGSAHLGIAGLFANRLLIQLLQGLKFYVNVSVSREFIRGIITRFFSQNSSLLNLSRLRAYK